MPVIHVHTSVSVQPGAAESFQAATIARLQQSTGELPARALSARIFQYPKDASKFLIWEAWDLPSAEADDVAALVALTASLPAYLDEIKPLLSAEPEAYALTPVAEHGRPVDDSAAAAADAPADGTLWTTVVDAVQADQREAFAKAACTMIDELVKEPECLFHQLSRDLSHPTRWIWLEQWRATQEWYHGLDDKPYMKRFFDEAGPLAAGPPDMTLGLKLVWVREALGPPGDGASACRA